MNLYFIVDLDGTICNSIPRIKKMCETFGISSEADLDQEWTSEQMMEFLSEQNLVQDEVVVGAERLFNMARKVGAEVVFLTGRNEYARKGTEKWLEKHFGEEALLCKLLMRSIDRCGEYSPLVKEDVFLDFRDSLASPSRFIFFEDQQDTAQRYSKYGLVLMSPKCWGNLL